MALGNTAIYCTGATVALENTAIYCTGATLARQNCTGIILRIETPLFTAEDTAMYCTGATLALEKTVPPAQEPLWCPKTPLYIQAEPLWCSKTAQEPLWRILNTALSCTGATVALENTAIYCTGVTVALENTAIYCSEPLWRCETAQASLCASKHRYLLHRSLFGASDTAICCTGTTLALENTTIFCTGAT